MPSLANELGHLASGHHADDLIPAERNHHELVANTFAADLLLPEDRLRAFDRHSVTERELADLIWQWGVSTDALACPLEGLGITVSDNIGQALQLPVGRRYHGFEVIHRIPSEAATISVPACPS